MAIGIEMIRSAVNELLQEVANLGRTAAWGRVVDFERMDERVSSANTAFKNLIGVNEEYIEWCPNDDPPDVDEALGWLWVVRPDLGDDISTASANDYLRAVIRRYKDNANC